MLRYVLAAAAVVCVSTSAHANDISGFRLEALLGWDNAKLENVGSKSGFAYGAGIGYDFPVGETISVGIDGEIMGATTDFEVSDGVDFVRVSTGRDIYVGGRITGKVADRVALYAKAGYSNARLELESSVTGLENVGGNGDGFRLGGGAQFLLGEKAYVGAEYRYTNYEADLIRHQILATFGYRF